MNNIDEKSVNHEPASSPLVSVVIPTYNRAAFVLKAVNSCLAGGYGNIEVVVVIDGSSDGTEALLWERAETDERIRLFPMEHGGVSSARNHGLDRANGKYVCFLDDDDVLNEGALPLFVERAEALGTDVLIGYNTVKVTIDGVVVENCPKTHFVSGLPEVFSHKDLGEKTLTAFRNSMNNKLIRTEFLRSGGVRFEPELIFGEDTVFGVRLGSRAERAAYIDEALVTVTRTDDHDNMMARRRLFDPYHFAYIKYIRREIDFCDSITDKQGAYIRFVLERLWSVYAKRYDDPGEYRKFAAYFREGYFSEIGVTEQLVLNYGTDRQIELYGTIMKDLPPPFPLSRTARMYLANKKLREKNAGLKRKNEALKKKNKVLREKVRAYERSKIIWALRKIGIGPADRN